VIMVAILTAGCEDKSGETSSAAGTRNPSFAPVHSGELATPSINPSPTEPDVIPTINIPNPIPLEEKALQVILTDIRHEIDENHDRIEHTASPI